MNKDNKKKLVLLDAHAIIHRAYHALPDFSSPKGEPTGALYGLVTMVLKTIKDLNPDYIIACFDVPEPTYRHDVYSDYKAGRAKTDDALIIQLKKSKDVFKALNIPIYEAVGFEADDVIGTIAKETEKDKNLSVIIASGDMDTLQLVEGERVRVLTLKKGIKDTVLYNEEKVLERFGFSPKLLTDFKGLRGDPSDNIPGIKGIGEKTATKLIVSFGKLEQILKIAEKEPEKILETGLKKRVIKLLTENKDEAVFSKMLATIRLDAPINFCLPNKKWKEGFDFKKTSDLFMELGFRTLINRFEEINGKKENSSKENKEKIKKQEKKELIVATWLIDSNLTQPTETDILNTFNCQTLPEAYEKAMETLKEKKLDSIFKKIEKPLIPILEKMTERGVVIDTKELQKIKKEYQKEIKKQEKKIWKLAGKKFNINSPKQMGEVLFDDLNLSIKNHKKTSTGAKSTKESELLKLQGEHVIIDEIIDYREVNKILSTYIEPILKMVDKKGRLHAEFVQTGTTTGRISSNNPNLQNIPVSSEKGRRIRDVFVSTAGFSFVAFDYSQIDLRIAALLSGDKKLITTFKNKEDIHSTVASEVFNVSKQKIDKEMRRRAKVINFGILYGMGVNSLKQNLKTSQLEAKDFLNRYFDRFSTLANYIEEVKKSAHKLGYTKTLLGRYRYIAGLNSPIPYIRAGAERMAVNAPIQGTAADVIKKASVSVQEFLDKKNKNKEAYLILQVHDELIFEVTDDFLTEFTNTVVNIMESVLEKEGYTEVPLEVHVKKGKSWGKMEKIS
jgi:DNA polymerase-1